MNWSSKASIWGFKPIEVYYFLAEKRAEAKEDQGILDEIIIIIL